MRMKPYLLATVSTLVLTGAASASEPAMMPDNWTGFYAGINGGVAWNLASAHAYDAGSDNGTASVDSVGGAFGGQAGYNWQSDDYLFGIEADWDWVDASGSHIIASTGPNNFTGYRFSSKLSSLATVRGRFGIVCPDALFYLTAGLAIGNVDNKASGDFYGGFPADNGTKVGWTIGGGAEHMIAPGWSVKAEALYADLGTSTVQGLLGSGYAFSTHNEAVIARVGLNYRF